MIPIAEFKDMVETNTLNIDLLIFICKDDDNFLANAYLDVICSNNGYGRHIIESLAEIDKKAASSMLDTFSSDLNILRTDVFSEDYDYGLIENTIVVCNKVDKKLMSKLDGYCVEMPKLKEQDIKDYAMLLCPEMNVEHLNWLYQVSDGSILKIENELHKINLFDVSKSNSLLIDLKNDDNTYLYNISTFAFVDAIVNHDLLVVNEALAHKTCWDSDPMFIMTLLLNKYKQIALVHGKSGLTASDMKMSDKQYNAIKYRYKGFNQVDLMNKINFLSGINLRINLGEFDCGNNSNFLDYLVCNIM